jgi:uridine kinase
VSNVIKKRVQVIGVAGASCSGKSMLCKQLQEQLSQTICSILPIDCYYKDLNHLESVERGNQNFDAPEALDHDLLINHLETLLSGKSVNIPEYDFSTHTRLSRSKKISHNTRIVLVEGLFALYWEKVRQLLSAKIFIDLDSEICLARRIERDVIERERSYESIERQFKQTVLPMYESTVAPTYEYADLVLRGDAPIHESVARVLAFISK